MRNLPSFSAWTGGASRPDAYRAFSLERDGESHIAESRHGRHNVSGLYSVQIQSKDRSECQFSLYPERQWNRQLSRRQLRAPTVLGNSFRSHKWTVLSLRKYNLPDKYRSAELQIIDLQGRIVQTLSLSGYGTGETEIDMTSHAPGLYIGILHVDGIPTDRIRLMKTE